MYDSDLIPNFYFLSDVKSQHLYWLWRARIPMARLTLLAGDPGLGKTLLAADLAARVSAGMPWPDAPPPPPKTVDYCPEPLLPGQPDGCPLLHTRPSTPPLSCSPVTSHLLSAEGHASPPATAQKRICPYAETADQLDCPYRLLPDSTDLLLEDFGRRHRPPVPMGVLFVSPEDPDSLRARLAAAGADLSRICILSGASARYSPRRMDPPSARSLNADDPDRQPTLEPLRLPAHADLIHQALRTFDLPALVIIDPLQSVLPPAGQGGPDGLAAALSALSKIAQRRGVAIVGIAHLAKARYLHTLYRVQGSVSLIGSARAAHLLSADPDQTDRRILFPIKTVYCKEPAPIACRIVPPGRLEWESAPSTEVCPPYLAPLTPEMLNLAPELHSALCEAADWLADYLLAEPKPFRQIQRDAFAAGISIATLRRAKRLLAIRSIQLPDHAGWVWSTAPLRPQSLVVAPARTPAAGTPSPAMARGREEVRA